MNLKLAQFCSKLFQQPFNPDEIFVLAIQGPSTSGKSTLADEIYQTLEKSGDPRINPVLINIDSCYKDLSERAETVDVKTYDMDNPAALDWAVFADCVKGYLSKSEYVKSYMFNYAETKRYERILKNKNFNVIILEGIFVHNLFNEQVFDIEKFSCTDSPNNYNIPFIKNYFGLEKYNFRLIKIFLNMDEETMRNTRVIVDYQRVERPADLSIKLFNEQVYPSTVHWVNTTGMQSSDIIIENGTKNIPEVTELFAEIMKFFNIKNDGSVFKAKLTELERFYKDYKNLAAN